MNKQASSTLWAVLLVLMNVFFVAQALRPKSTLEPTIRPEARSISAVNASGPADRRSGFVASGSEPFWRLTLYFDAGLHFETVGGESIDTPPVRGVRVRNPSATRYRAKTPAGRLSVWVYDRPCVDAMSGRDFPRTVRVTLDEKRYEGCGRFVDERAPGLQVNR